MDMKKSFILIMILVLFSEYLNAQVNQEFIINKYKPIAEKIISKVMSDSSSYKNLGYVCDVFGHRLSGSENLENAIRWIVKEMKNDGLDNVRTDSVMVPHWVRGNEECIMTSPWKHKIPVLAFGGSISTPKGGIKAKVLVVNGFEDLAAKKDLAKGRIVVYNVPFKNYGQAVQFRFVGAINAAQAGAIASLTRSVTPQNLVSVHTGMMVYADTVEKIPHGAISIEDAELLQRLQDRGISPEMSLTLESESLPDVLSYNVLGELRGNEKAEEIIAFGGHIDGWDLGTGAHDDASACIASWGAIKILKDLGLAPKRTLRSVMWANEENGARGGKAYAAQHGDEPHALVFEWDSGCFAPSAVRFTCDSSLFQILKLMEPILKLINKDLVVDNRGGGVDIGPMMRLGYPGGSLSTNDQGKYFVYHHSDSDTFEKIVFNEYNQCLAAMAVSLYIYADLPIDYFKYIKKN